MSNVFTRLFSRKGEKPQQGQRVGNLPTESSPIVAGLLGGIMPYRGDPPPRGRQDYLRAYSTMPWLRAVSDRVAGGVAAVEWQVLAVKGKAGKFVRDPILQRADFRTRQKMLARHKAAGDLVELTDHPLYELLHGGNDMMTGGTVRALTVLYLDLVGEGFFIKQRNVAGVPVGLWPMPPHWVQETPTPSTLKFKLQVNTWTDSVDDADVLWLKRADPLNPYGRGTGVAQALADELETDEYAAKMTKARMWNRALPDVLISPKDTKATIDETAAKTLEQKWTQKLRGLFRQGNNLHILSRAVQVDQISQTFQELQLVPLRQFERDTIIQVYGIPPEKLGVLENSNRSTIEGADLIFAKDLVVPRCEFLREHYQERLAPEYDDRIVVAYVSPVGEDRDRQLEAATAAPWSRTINEWRELQGLPPDEKSGKGHMVPIGMSYVEDLADDVSVAPSVSAGDGSDATATDEAKTISKVAPAIARPSIFRASANLKAIALDDDYYTLVHRVADKLEPKLRRQFLQAIGKIQDATLLSDLENALASGQVHGAYSAIPWSRLEAELNGGTQIIRAALDAAGDASASELSGALGVTLAFDRTNPAAESWAQANAARYITEISDSTRSAIRELIASGYADQIAPAELAKMVRDSIGLHSRQVAALETLRAELVADGVSGDTLSKMLTKAAAQKLRYRAQTIASHELLTASNQGQRQLWNQAEQKGHLDPSRTKRMLIVTHDDRCDSTCLKMEGQQVGLHDAFVTPDGEKIEDPPIHVKCRCAEGLVIG